MAVDRADSQDYSHRLGLNYRLLFYFFSPIGLMVPRITYHVCRRRCYRDVHGAATGWPDIGACLTLAALALADGPGQLFPGLADRSGVNTASHCNE
jgi:hypothetical protein